MTLLLRNEIEINSMVLLASNKMFVCLMMLLVRWNGEEDAVVVDAVADSVAVGL